MTNLPTLRESPDALQLDRQPAISKVDRPSMAESLKNDFMRTITFFVFQSLYCDRRLYRLACFCRHR